MKNILNNIVKPKPSIGISETRGADGKKQTEAKVVEAASWGSSLSRMLPGFGGNEESVSDKQAIDVRDDIAKDLNGGGAKAKDTANTLTIRFKEGVVGDVKPLAIFSEVGEHAYAHVRYEGNVRKNASDTDRYASQLLALTAKHGGDVNKVMASDEGWDSLVRCSRTFLDSKFAQNDSDDRGDLNQYTNNVYQVGNKGMFGNVKLFVEKHLKVAGESEANDAKILERNLEAALKAVEKLQGDDIKHRAIEKATNNNITFHSANISGKKGKENKAQDKQVIFSARRDVKTLMNAGMDEAVKRHKEASYKEMVDVLNAQMQTNLNMTNIDKQIKSDITGSLSGAKAIASNKFDSYAHLINKIDDAAQTELKGKGSKQKINGIKQRTSDMRLALAKSYSEMMGKYSQHYAVKATTAKCESIVANDRSSVESIKKMATLTMMGSRGVSELERKVREDIMSLDIPDKSKIDLCIKSYNREVTGIKEMRSVFDANTENRGKSWASTLLKVTGDIGSGVWSGIMGRATFDLRATLGMGGLVAAGLGIVGVTLGLVSVATGGALVIGGVVAFGLIAGRLIGQYRAKAEKERQIVKTVKEANVAMNDAIKNSERSSLALKKLVSISGRGAIEGQENPNRTINLDTMDKIRQITSTSSANVTDDDIKGILDGGVNLNTMSDEEKAAHRDVVKFGNDIIREAAQEAPSDVEAKERPQVPERPQAPKRPANTMASTENSVDDTTADRESSGRSQAA